MTETFGISTTYTLYSTTTCGRCPVARRVLKNSGVRWREVKLDEPGNELLVESIREELGGDNIEVPMILTPGGDLLRNLAYISDHFREKKVA